MLECTGAFLTKEKAQDHLDAGAQVVVLSGPSKDDTPMFVCGVNLDAYTPDIKIVSNASCTTNCLAPLAKIINDNFGIAEGLMTTVHADTATQQVVDGFSKKNWRLSAVCTATSSRPAPALPSGRQGHSGPAGQADRHFHAHPERGRVHRRSDLPPREAATYDEICAAVKAAAEGPMAGVVEYVDDEVVSSDFITDPHTSIFDAKAGLALNDHFVKLMAWYDNEWGFSNKMLDLTRHIDSVRKA